MNHHIHIHANQVSKRYGRRWIIRHFDYRFEINKRYAVMGPNGSGKSTLMKMLSGYTTASKGEVQYYDGKEKLSAQTIYQHMTYVAPYITPPRHFSIAGMIQYYATYKRWRPHINEANFYDLMALPKPPTTQLSDLSSGQLQRFCLALALLTDSAILLLDEPTSFLDTNSKTWFYTLLEQHISERIVIIASNDIDDLSLMQDKIHIKDYSAEQ